MANTIDIITNELVSGKTISEALFNVYSKRNVTFSYNPKWFDVDVRNLNMSSRIVNALMRAHLCTLNDVIKFVEDGHGLTEIRAMGVDSCYKLMETILDCAWDHMNTKERAEFLIDVTSRNEQYLKA